MPELVGMDTYTFHRSPASLSGCSHRPTTPRGALFPLIVGLALAATATADSRLEYFGFSGGCESETFVQETAPFSNLCVIDIQDQRLLDHEWVAKMTVRDVKDFLYVMDSWWTAALHGEEGIAPLDMAEVARNYYLMASEDPDAVGLLGFHWPTFVLRQSESTMRKTAGCCGSLNRQADPTAGPSPCPAEGEWPINKPEFHTSR